MDSSYELNAPQPNRRKDGTKQVDSRSRSYSKMKMNGHVRRRKSGGSFTPLQRGQRALEMRRHESAVIPSTFMTRNGETPLDTNQFTSEPINMIGFAYVGPRDVRHHVGDNKALNSMDAPTLNPRKIQRTKKQSKVIHKRLAKTSRHNATNYNQQAHVNQPSASKSLGSYNNILTPSDHRTSAQLSSAQGQRPRSPKHYLASDQSFEGVGGVSYTRITDKGSLGGEVGYQKDKLAEVKYPRPRKTIDIDSKTYKPIIHNNSNHTIESRSSRINHNPIERQHGVQRSTQSTRTSKFDSMQNRLKKSTVVIQKSIDQSSITWKPNKENPSHKQIESTPFQPIGSIPTDIMMSEHRIQPESRKPETTGFIDGDSKQERPKVKVVNNKTMETMASLPSDMTLGDINREGKFSQEHKKNLSVIKPTY